MASSGALDGQMSAEEIMELTRQQMLQAGIDPDTGLPLDPKERQRMHRRGNTIIKRTLSKKTSSGVRAKAKNGDEPPEQLYNAAEQIMNCEDEQQMLHMVQQMLLEMGVDPVTGEPLSTSRPIENQNIGSKSPSAPIKYERPPAGRRRSSTMSQLSTKGRIDEEDWEDVQNPFAEKDSSPPSSAPLPSPKSFMGNPALNHNEPIAIQRSRQKRRARANAFVHVVRAKQAASGSSSLAKKDSVPLAPNTTQSMSVVENGRIPLGENHSQGNSPKPQRRRTYAELAVDVLKNCQDEAQMAGILKDVVDSKSIPLVPQESAAVPSSSPAAVRSLKTLKTKRSVGSAAPTKEQLELMDRIIACEDDQERAILVLTYQETDRQIVAEREQREARRMQRTVSRKLTKTYSKMNAFERNKHDGFHSDTFDLNQNLQMEDSRQGLAHTDEIAAIMREHQCSFDDARHKLAMQRMREAGIDPETGLPIDAKAFSFETMGRQQQTNRFSVHRSHTRSVRMPKPMRRKQSKPTSQQPPQEDMITSTLNFLSSASDQIAKAANAAIDHHLGYAPVPSEPTSEMSQSNRSTKSESAPLGPLIDGAYLKGYSSNPNMAANPPINNLRSPMSESMFDRPKPQTQAPSPRAKRPQSTSSFFSSFAKLLK